MAENGEPAEKAQLLADLEALAHTNPLYAWKAFAEDCPRGKPLPGWIEDYLRACACQLLDMAEPEVAEMSGKRPVTPGKAVKSTPQVLGLSRIGWNAFAEYRRNQRNAYVAMVREGKPRPSIRKLAGRYGIKPGTVGEWIRRAERLWNSQ